MRLYDADSLEFKAYGRIITLDADELITRAKKLEMPEEGSVYEASLAELEACAAAEELQNEIFGETAIQIGCCYGHSDSLNALEWHKSSEVNIAVTDMILFLGKLDEMNGNKYASGQVKPFFVKKGTAIELYATTMHFCPCETDKGGFMSIVALPKGTNLPLDKPRKDKLLFRKNKWLIAHTDNSALIERGVMPGVYGINYKVGRDI